MFIGPNAIKETKDVLINNRALKEVTYENGQVEYLSPLMYEKVASEESCDLTALRDKRVFPVVEAMLELLRDWGVRLGELSYFSILLQQSLEYNQKEALKELWSAWMPKPNDVDDVDLIAVDRVLKSNRKTLKEILGQ